MHHMCPLIHHYLQRAVFSVQEASISVRPEYNCVWSLVLILHLKLLYNSSTGSDMMRVRGFIPYKGWNLTCHSNFIHFSHLKSLKSSIGINWSSSSYGADDQIHSSTCERFYKSRHFDIHVCEHNATTFPVVDIPAGTRNKYGLF